MYRIGVEIGGTKLQVGLGKKDGRIERMERVPADVEGGHEAILGQIAELVWRVRSEADVEVERVGIGFGGPVNVKTGCVIVSHQVRGWSGFALREVG
jgi:glucokinase